MKKYTQILSIMLIAGLITASFFMVGASTVNEATNAKSEDTTEVTLPPQDEIADTTPQPVPLGVNPAEVWVTQHPTDYTLQKTMPDSIIYDLGAPSEIVTITHYNEWDKVVTIDDGFIVERYDGGSNLELVYDGTSGTSLSLGPPWSAYPTTATWTWDMRDANGLLVEPGAYIIRTGTQNAAVADTTDITVILIYDLIGIGIQHPTNGIILITDKHAYNLGETISWTVANLNDKDILTWVPWNYLGVYNAAGTVIGAPYAPGIHPDVIYVLLPGQWLSDTWNQHGWYYKQTGNHYVKVDTGQVPAGTYWLTFSSAIADYTVITINP